MLDGKASSLYCGAATIWSARPEREGALVVKFKGECVPIEQDEVF